MCTTLEHASHSGAYGLFLTLLIHTCRWMTLEEFISTQDHPLILQVCQRVLGLDSTYKAGDGKSLEPLAEMLPAGVQWPGREPYPSYFASSRRVEVPVLDVNDV